MLYLSQQVLLYLSSHASTVKAWLKSSRWSQDSALPPLAISVIVNEECRSVGDACRDLDEKGVVRGEFVLVGPGACLVAGAGLGLDLALERHRAMAGRDRHCVMTCLYTEAAPGHPLRLAGQELVLATEKNTDQVREDEQKTL